ncbi:putative Transcriptional regulator, GntR family [Candidatus Sulfopaludibacter sp. SbA3]|nr:putative Transcriptional regulator, GntR family [Candidatus Sulfopaludibacter sp. SbA3]
MILTIDPGDSRPIYQQVADGIKSLIARGELKEGASLPPVRQIAADLAVNLNTIATAYRELQEEGLITIKHGQGATVCARKPPQKNADDLRKPLRTALTDLILAGLSPTRIRALVADELNDLMRGVK